MSGRRAIGVAVAALVVLAVGVTIGFVLTSAKGDSAAQRRSPSTTRNSAAPSGSLNGSPSAPAPIVITRSVVVTASAPAVTDQSSEAPVSDDAVYSAPGGLTVRGPSGWVENDSAHLSQIRDFIPADSPARLAGPNFRIGIGNRDPGGDIVSEAELSVRYLKKSLRGYVSAPHYVQFMGTTAADIQFQFMNDDPAVERRGVERLWRSNGETLIIVSSDLSENWLDAQQVFRELTSSASVG